MDKNYQYYNNRNKYGNICVPRRKDILNYLIKEKFLSEFSTEEEKQRVLNNLGITQKLQQLALLISEKADNQELDNYVLLSELNKYITFSEFLRRIKQLKPKDEKSKGYYSSYESLIAEYPGGETGDWAIVNVDGNWYVYKYISGTGWVQSGIYDNSVDLSEYAKLVDLDLFQRVLISGQNIKTINGQTILGEGNIEISGGGGGGEVSGDYVTREELNNYITMEDFYNIQNPLKVTVNVSPSLVEYTGNSRTITITAQAKKGNTDINNATYTISYGTVSNESFNKTYSALISVKGTTTFTVNCQSGSETASAKGSVNFVLPTYYGFDNTDNYNSVDLSKLTKKIKSSISSTETLENLIAGSYLWIVSPFTLDMAATDPGYTYRVAMNSMGSKDGLNYYRSNSAVDISNLTYYIK